MESLQLKAVLSGICFGIWPLLMNRSGLSGNLSTFAFALTVTVCVLPFTLGNLGDIAHSRWLFVLAAGILGAIGLIFFNGMLSKATPKDVGTLFVLMVVVQVAVPAIYKVVLSGITLEKGIGFALAAIAAVLLMR